MPGPKLRPIEIIPVLLDGRNVLALRDPTQLVETTLLLPAEMLPVIRYLDGENSVREIQAAYMREEGELLYSDLIENVIDKLDEAYFLDNDRFDRYRQGLVEAFRSAAVRACSHSGKAYPADPGELRSFFGSLLSGAGESRPGPTSGPLRGLVAPHIDLRAGGRCFAQAYCVLGNEEGLSTFVILGTSHTGDRMFALTRKHFETPLGIVETDQELVDRIAASVGYDPFEDELVHRTEHSVEFQVLWLQQVRREPFKIVAFLCGPFQAEGQPSAHPMDLPEVRETTDVLKQIIVAAKGRAAIIAGADLAHIGPRYGDREPVNRATLQWIGNEDDALQSYIDNVDAEGFYQAVMADGNRRKICGLAPIYVLLKVLEGGRGRRLGYDIWHDSHSGSAVSYVSAEIR